MKETSNGPRYLMRWDHSRDQDLVRDIVVTSHRLGELAWLFGDRLAEVIDSLPRQSLSVRSPGDDPIDPDQWQQGDLGGCCGAEIVETIGRGRLWVTVADLQTHHLELRQVIARLCGELRECHPGLRTFAESGRLQISSPAIRTHYHCDTAPLVLWNIRGCRRVSVRPLDHPSLSRATVEDFVSGRRDVVRGFESTVDDRAEVFDLLPGQMISIPQYLPYRFENSDGVNVTLETRHMTPQAERQNNVHLANQWLRPVAPMVAGSDRTNGIVRYLRIC